MDATRRFLHRSVMVFKVLAWLSLAIQAIVGLVVLIMGGPPIPVGDVDVPARVVGLLNFIAAAIYFFIFLFLAHATRLLLDVHGGAGQVGASGR